MSIADDTRPDIAERYAAATTSSNLRCEARTQGPLDVIVSAAWANEEDGGILARARNEFDNVHASIPASVGATNRRMLAAMGMGTLMAAKIVVRRWAAERAERRGWEYEEDELHKVAWQALSTYLDPACPMCTGRTFSGGYDGTPHIRCGHCHETGKRRGFVGNTDAQRDFIEALIVRIESSVCDFAAATQRKLRA
jgi:hypothetical protein